LGTTFIKNFYTALDYERNLVIVGLNELGKNHTTKIIVDPEGKKGPPPKDNYQALVTFFMLILAFLFACLYRAHVLEQRRKNAKFVPKWMTIGPLKNLEWVK